MNSQIHGLAKKPMSCNI